MRRWWTACTSTHGYPLTTGWLLASSVVVTALSLHNPPF